MQPVKGHRPNRCPTLLPVLIVAVVLGGAAWSRFDADPPVAPVAVPATGSVDLAVKVSDETLFGTLKLTGLADGRHCTLRLESWNTGEPVATIFVRSAKTAAVRIPIGYYRGMVACGKRWYGPQHFGEGAMAYELAEPVFFVRNDAEELVGTPIVLSDRQIEEGSIRRATFPGGSSQ